MNEKYKINTILYELKKIYNSNGWIIHNLGEGYVYLYYKNKQILHFKSKIPSVEAVTKFIILCIVDAPQEFGIKNIVCKLRKKQNLLL